MINLLFVDDEPKLLAELERTLKRYRHEWNMTFVDKPEQALALLAEETYDVVVADLKMPGIDGGKLLRRVEQEWPQAIRILVSGRSECDQAMQAAGAAQQHLSKPCDPETLHMTIADMFALRYHLQSKAIRELVGRLGQLPTLPDVYTELIHELESPNASVARVGEIISKDVSISAKILQLVNSSYFGLPVHVTDVPHAVALLGLSVIKPLVLSSGLFTQFAPGSLGKFSLSYLVDHSTEVALAARCIAQLEAAPAEVCDHAFMAGMLHDLGQLVLAKNFTAQYDQLRRHARQTESPLDEVETAEFEASHADLGAYLLGLWGLPTPIVEAIVWHHNPLASTHDEFAPLAAVHVAEALLDRSGNANGENSALSHEFIDRIGRTGRLSVWSVALGAEVAQV